MAMFAIGFCGIIINKQNLIIIILSIELLLLGINLLLIVRSVYLDDLLGQFVVLMVLLVAGAESAIGLGTIVTYYCTRGNISPDETIYDKPSLFGDSSNEGMSLSKLCMISLTKLSKIGRAHV